MQTAMATPDRPAGTRATGDAGSPHATTVPSRRSARVARRPADTCTASPTPGGTSAAPTSPEPASIYSGRLIGSNGEQDPETDLGLITSIHYYANTTNNQSISILAKKGDKTNLCHLQYNPSVMSKTWPRRSISAAAGSCRTCAR